MITGTELQHLSDDEVIERLPQLHVFGRVAPEDKLRLAKLMQQSGDVVAMTGDAVNDAAALKQADVGVAMGSGSEVTKQAAKIVLTDDNFATLVQAVDLGRDIYRRISTYIRMQLTILSSVLQLMVYATILNINGGVALFPLQLLFCKFFVVITVVIGFIVDVPDPGVMQRPPRRPGTKIVTTPQVIRWFVTGFVVAATALSVLEWGPGKPSTTHASVNMTMAFAIVSFSAVNIGLVMRRERQAPWSSPVFPYLGWIILGWILTWAAVELDMLQRLLDTTSLSGREWVVVLALSLIAPAVVAVDKVIQLRRQSKTLAPEGADGDDRHQNHSTDCPPQRDMGRTRTDPMPRERHLGRAGGQPLGGTKSSRYRERGDQHAVRSELRGGQAAPGDGTPTGPGTRPPDPVQRRRAALRRRAVGGAGQGRA